MELSSTKSETKSEKLLNDLLSFNNEVRNFIVDAAKSSPESAVTDVLLNQMDTLAVMLKKNQHLAPKKTTGLRGECTSPSPEEVMVQKPRF